MMEKDERSAQTGNDLILTGATVGAIGVVGALLLGATCPLCVVATPALIGSGLYKRWRGMRASTEAPDTAVAEAPAAKPGIEPSG